jgi:hypothetical protein
MSLALGDINNAAVVAWIASLSEDEKAIIVEALKQANLVGINLEDHAEADAAELLNTATSSLRDILNEQRTAILKDLTAFRDETIAKLSALSFGVK